MSSYAPQGPDGKGDLLVGGDRLTEANCRNIQWSLVDGHSEESRLDGMVFKFEDWHAIRNLFEVHIEKDGHFFIRKFNFVNVMMLILSVNFIF